MRAASSTASRQRGVTLIELMISMVLGLLVIAGAVSLTLANRRSYSTNEGLSQVQEGGRSAFEFLARDIRQGGVSGCNSNGIITYAIPVSTNAAVIDWDNWLQGYDDTVASSVAFGTARGDRVSGTDAFRTQGLQGAGLTVANPGFTGNNDIIVNGTSDAQTGDLMVICDLNHAAMFQVTAVSGTNTIRHQATGTNPGNTYDTLGSPINDPNYLYKQNSLVAPLSVTEWYVGRSGRTTDTGRSLFRRRLNRGGGFVTEEMVNDVTNMQITYRLKSGTDFVSANSITTVADWNANVVAVQVALTISSSDANVTTTPGTNNGRVLRTFNQVFALRNRVP